MRIGNIEVENPLFLGPMAGVTDWAFRTVCAELGAGVTVTEMVSSRALVYQDKKSISLLRKNKGSICGAQIFGNDPEIMAKSAVLALGHSGCDFIDINMGCPMPKIANSGDGCGLMRTPELAGEIVKSVVAAVDVPVTVKCRLGWDKGSINVLDFAKRMEDNGAAMLTVHGRTRSMLYSGTADWDMIAKVKQQSGIPVIANGDVVDGESAMRCLKWTGADGLMIGRASLVIRGSLHRYVRLCAVRRSHPDRSLLSAWTWRCASLNLPMRTKVSILPAWKQESTLRGTFGVLLMPIIIRNKYLRFRKWMTFTALRKGFAEI